MKIGRGLLVVVAACFFDAALAADFSAQIIGLEGQGTVLRSPANARARMKLGDVLAHGDVISMGPASRLHMMFPDGEILLLDGELEIVVTPALEDRCRRRLDAEAGMIEKLMQPSRIDPRAMPSDADRNANNAALAPRRTKVVSDQELIFVWRSVPGTRQYRFSLLDSNGQIHQETLPKTYTHPPRSLTADAQYYWEVRNASPANAQTQLGSGEFATLPPATALAVERFERQIDAVFSPDDERDRATSLFLRFRLYHAHEMYLAALFCLEQLIAGDSTNQELLLWRQDLCRLMGINEQDIVYLQRPDKMNPPQ